MHSRRRSRSFACLITSSAFLAVAFLGGCSTCHPTAEYGVDLLENTERSTTSRTFAGIGAVLGMCVALPFTVILAPSYAFEGNEGQEAVVEPRADGADAQPSDVRMPLALAPMAYCRGVGAVLLGAPAAWIEESISGPPGRPADWLDEEPDRYPEEFPEGEPAVAGGEPEEDVPAATDGDETVNRVTFSEHRAS